MVLHQTNQGSVLLAPENVVEVKSTNYGTGIVTEDYSFYEVQEDVEEIKEMMVQEGEQQSEEEQQ